MKSLSALLLLLIASQQVTSEIYESDEHPNLIGDSLVERLRDITYGIDSEIENGANKTIDLFNEAYMSLDENDGKEWRLDDEDSSEVRNLQAINKFDSLLEAPCNAGLNSNPCTTPLSTLVQTGSPTIIPCGTCAVVDSALGDSITLSGLNIEGKLVFPKNHKITISTPFVYVQGQLDISADKEVSPENLSVSFILTGAADQSFIPHTFNADSCGGACRVGKKPFIVAGGKVNIQAYPDHCPTWVKVIDTKAGEGSVPTEWDKPVPTPQDCSRILIDEDFESGDGNWDGNLGAAYSVVDDGTGNKVLKVTERKWHWQGPELDMSMHRGCLVPNVEYLFSAKIRLSRTDGETSRCRSRGSDCIRLSTQASNEWDQKRWFLKEAIRPKLAPPDGEWFDVTFQMKFEEHETKIDSTFEVIYITGPEAGVDIEIDNIRLELPPESGYPDGDHPEEMCSELFPGQAVEGSIHPFPLNTNRVNHNGNSYTPLLVKSDDEGTYYSVVGRWENWASLTFPIISQCMTQGAGYTVSTKIRLHSSNPVTDAYMELEILGLVNGRMRTINRLRIASCPAVGGDLGWVQCTGMVSLSEDFSGNEIKWRLVTGRERFADIDYRDLSMKAAEASVQSIVLDKSVQGCWGAGSKLLITSNTPVYDAHQVAEIETITANKDGKTVTAKLSNVISSITTEMKDSDMAVEVALLDRNVVIKGARDDNTFQRLHGGYMSIFYTPTVQQVIQGVLFEYMGQQGLHDRFPLQFKMCEDVEGSVVSKNTFLDSNQRCVVLQDTTKAVVDGNIAYKTSGMCFMTQDGGEIENVFKNNLGAETIRSRFAIDNDDRYPATFAARNPNNEFSNNVAAGSNECGFRISLSHRVVGASAPKYGGYQPRKEAIGAFKNNVAHSSKRGFCMYHFQSDDVKGPDQAIVSIKAYRNTWNGIKFYGTKFLNLNGAFLSDNKYGFEVENCESLKITDTKVVGLSETQKEILLSQTVPNICGHQGQVGILVSPYRVYKDTESGIELENVDFKGFDATEGCDNSYPIDFIRYTKNNHWDVSMSLKNVNINDSRGSYINGCSTASINVNDVVITDVDNKLSPDTSKTSTGFSSIVSSQPWMTTFATGTCTEMPGQCLSYCENTCLRTLTFNIDRDISDGYTLYLQNSDGSKSIEVSGNLEVNNNPYWNNLPDKYRMFSVSLPAGEYTAEFQKDGVSAHPRFVRKVWELEPQCSGHVDVDEVSLQSSPDHVCGDLVANGNMDEGIAYWTHSGEDIQALPGQGIDGGNAIGSKRRHSPYQGLGQYFDTVCMKKNVGKTYEFKAWVKLVDFSGNPVTCNPADNHPQRSCPSVTLKISSTDATQTTTDTYRHYVATTLQPYVKGEFNLVHGVIYVDDELANADSIYFSISRFSSSNNIIMDDISLTQMESSCDKIVTNGDFSTGNHLFWSTWSGGQIEMVPGYGGDGSALKVYRRGHWNHGPAHDLVLGCLQEGERYIVKTTFKLEDHTGKLVTCNPFSWAGRTRCPNVQIVAKQPEGNLVYVNVAKMGAPSAVEGWDSLAGYFYVSDKMIRATKLTVAITGAHPINSIIVDNLEITMSPQTCSNVALNPSFDDGSTDFWATNSVGNSKIDLYSPGAGGSQYAIRSYDRTRSWMGLLQEIDPTCFVEGEELVFTAKTRLLNKDGAGVACDSSKSYSDGKTNCPLIVLQARNCPGNANYWLWNELHYPYKANEYNDFQSKISVDSFLSKCKTLWLTFRYVNEAWDMVIDDVKVVSSSAYVPTKNPTIAPTTATPTASTLEPTRSPSLSPSVSSAPTGIAKVCPLEGEPPKSISSGPIILTNSGESSLCTLTKQITDGKDLKILPIARSYEGNSWEKGPGELSVSIFKQVDLECTPSTCSLELPSLTSGENYVLTSYSHTTSNKDTVARLLESTTFGVTKADLESWNYSKDMNEVTAEWVKDQIGVDMTSHREYWRSRSNPVWTYPRKGATLTSPCDPNSRWRKYAFNGKDGTQPTLPKYIATSGDGPYVVSVNGVPRTVVDELKFLRWDQHSFDHSIKHRICTQPFTPSKWWPKGRLFLNVDEDHNTCQEVHRDIGNPPINFDGHENLITYFIQFTDDDGLEVIDEEFTLGQELILKTGIEDARCDGIPDVFEELDHPVFAKMADGTWLIHDRRLELQENTVDTPLSDGGGSINIETGEDTMCMNAPRTFLNEKDCKLSLDGTACGSIPAPVTEILLDDENILQLQNITGRYIYALNGLVVKDNSNQQIKHPCTPGLRSRWEKTSEECENPTSLGAETLNTLQRLFEIVDKDLNAHLRDIIFPKEGMTCASTDVDPEIQIQVGTACWEHRHPEYMSVYDFTYWSRNENHPGNMAAEGRGVPNPIKKWKDIYGSATMTYPSSHPEFSYFNHGLNRWNEYHEKFDYLGRYGDAIRFRDLPNEIRIDEVAEHYGVGGNAAGKGVIVCGSPGEVSNDKLLGDSDFDMAQDYGERDTTSFVYYQAQREIVWATIALSASDQLRQKMAWALSQILVVVKDAIFSKKRNTEIFLQYYDILVRHAFGNYRDILKEISYSPLMAENLSFLQSKSHAYMWERTKKRTFADENFAREIMQLFSTGLMKLHLDGTPMTDESGKHVDVYTTRHIMSFARAWTGFDMQLQRGNMENYERSGNRLDPMKIVPEWRDKFPKIDLKGGYIGDSYPLCTDEPAKKFLKKGAKYRLLGSSPLPELVEDDSNFKDDKTILRFVLNADSILKSKICAADDSGACQFKNEVILDSDITCIGSECDVEIPRVLQVSDGVFYEYVRAPCVHLAFFKDAKKINLQNKNWVGTMCANPTLPEASEACCPTPLPSGYKVAHRYNMFDGERMSFDAASARCAKIGKQLCDYNKIHTDEIYKTGYHWTTDECKIRLKIDPSGDVALVYEMEAREKVAHIDMENGNFFPVAWEGGLFPSSDNTCASEKCQSNAFGECLCETEIIESVVFDELPVSKQDVFDKLSIGAYNPNDFGTFDKLKNEADDVLAYTVNGTIDKDTVFEVFDDFGRVFYYKNTISNVNIVGLFGQSTEFSFQNPPHFMSLVPTEASVRDAQYETEAVLDDYFYHENTAPFLAVRLIQRFGISNPSPRYVSVVANAFRAGIYVHESQTFGTERYGDLEATVAAIVLDREARSVILDVDPTYGSMKEPLLKVIALMRNLDFKPDPVTPNVQLDNMSKLIGQMAHQLPTVFSFFLPEYVPEGPLSAASLVSPESMVLDMPKIIDSLNGMFSLIRYGLSDCYGGFGVRPKGAGQCLDDGTYTRNSGILGYDPAGLEPAQIIDELSTLMTAGRLGEKNKKILLEAYNAVDGTAAATRTVQQLLITAPEFHSTNVVKSSGEERTKPDDLNSSQEPYKATVFLMLAGGCDSFNLLAPHTCTPKEGKDVDLYTEYSHIRQQVGMSRARLLPIDTENHVCSKFGIHNELQILQKLYNDNDAVFFANTGVLNKPTTKRTWNQDHVTKLFAHNTMQQELKRVDPFDTTAGTGVMGRIRDALTKKGINSGSLAIDGNSIALTGYPGISTPTSIIGNGGISQFDKRQTYRETSLPQDDFHAKVLGMNSATESDSGFFAETWSSVLTRSLSENSKLLTALESVTTSVEFPNSALGRKLEMVAKLMQTSETRNVNRDLFYLEIGGFDSHANVDDNLIKKFKEINSALTAFYTELKNKDIWDKVALVETSDFGRTLQPNGNHGTDHAWGGNYFMVGGPVKGGKILGEYPDDFSADTGDHVLRRGRLVPSTSWEQIWNGIAQWMGVDETELNDVCPNRANFPDY